MNLPEDDRIAPPARGDDGLPELEVEKSPAAVGEEQDLRSLREDVAALIEDGRTYLETELVYQKSRAAFVADRAKGAVVYGAVAVLLAILALVGLILGLILALTPLLTAWGASALVVGLLVIGALVAGQSAARRWDRVMRAIEGGGRSGTGERQ